MDEPQTLPASRREDHRYLVFEVVEGDTGVDTVQDAIESALLDVLGELGAARVDAWLMRDTYDPSSGRGLLKVRHGHVAAARTALMLITAIDDAPATLQVLGVTGTVDSARDQYLS